ncbi:MAG: nucleotide sugar dehydrogenase [Candidatus Aenigmatarchaeota archaeon]|nr:nucleotide sugar dehydrogenase [Candidatus Aenigmarchaeota archaeon]
MSYLELLHKIIENKFTLGVIGIGRVGLPLSVTFAQKGINVIGFDINDELIKKVNSLTAPFFEPNLDIYLKETMKSNKFSATNDYSLLKNVDVIIITVGTPLNEHFVPDYSQLFSALDKIVQYPIKNKLIILRSTSSPGTLENIVKPYLEKKTNLKAGEDFYLAVCPERIVEGKAIEELQILPEIIGGVTETCSKLASEIFRKLNSNKKIFVTTPKAAELGKLFTNVYRYVNFALANEFGLIAEEHGEDAHEIIRIVNEDYNRCRIPTPGLTGGPCLSKDGYFLTQHMPFPEFIQMASKLNENIPNHIIKKLKKELEREGKILTLCKVAVLGLAYKSGIDDTRLSPAVKIADLLKDEGCEVKTYDPYVYPDSSNSLSDVVRDADAIIIAVNHPEFKDLPSILNVLNKEPIVIDCWKMFDEKEIKGRYIAFGKGK